MVRAVPYFCVALLLMAEVAEAGQNSASFNVGLTIGPRTTSLRASPSTYTWGAAEISVKSAGFGNLQRVDKQASLYWFAGTRNGASFRISVSSLSGHIVEILPA